MGDMRGIIAACEDMIVQSEKLYNQKVRSRYNSRDDYEIAFFHKCHEAAQEGDEMDMVGPSEDLYEYYLLDDMRIIWNTYIWHYNRALERSKGR